ncbi:MAG: ArsR family transcriptional regulator [Nanoarchaeota archaeon]|nr:ArsR family transcriptional regulator [Nanoarchaeota archaeon]
MAQKYKTREITITDEGGSFHTFFRRITGGGDEYDFEGIALLRKILSNQKARVLNTIKTKKPRSIYELAKVLERDFKSVNDDVKLLEKFGFIDMVSEKTGKRGRLRPVLAVDSMYIQIKL